MSVPLVKVVDSCQQEGAPHRDWVCSRDGDPCGTNVSWEVQQFQGASIFIATMDTHENSRKGDVQIYHTLLLNRGAGMDPDSGRFTAPVTGLYR